MIGRIETWVAMLLLTCVSMAQDTLLQRVELRVSRTRPGGIVTIDRGTSAGLRQGDAVRFFQSDGAVHQGRIIDVGDRTSLVELNDKTVVLISGTRGESRIPSSRSLGGAGNTAVDHQPWQNTDETWEPGMPLLAEMEAVYPADRAMQFSGRLYTSLDQIVSTEDGRTDGFWRIGTDLVYENLFGRGGELKIDGEANYRSTNVDDRGGEHRADTRLDRLSYTLGGTRFWHQRLEVGRFLHYGMPEFGVVDGIEYSQRLPSGDRVGGSVGFMPEPDDRFQSGHDFQLSAFYQYVADAEERFTATGGYQKTWHGLTVDRDLLVGKVRYLPADGWDVYGTAFVDLYLHASDDEKPLLEFTQLQASATRRLSADSGVNVTYRHLVYPQLDRNEFRPVMNEQLEEDYNERLTVGTWRQLSTKKKMHGQAGLWVDEDQGGGDVELGIEHSELLAKDSVTDTTLFFSVGQFTSLAGARIAQGWFTDFGRWDVFYEIEIVDHDDFDDERDDVLQHWLRLSRDFFPSTGWDVSASTDVRRFAGETSFSVGVYLQKSF